MTPPTLTCAPANEQELVQIVQEAMSTATAVEVRGGGSKSGMSSPDRNTSIVSTAAFDRIIDYDPSELVMTVGAGVRMSTIDELLRAQGQMLAFEPAVSEQSTIGGVIAAGMAGSRRVSAGNVRDHLLGFSAVSGRGEAFVAGGRVVKNVTGYDVSKLMCGSWGALAILSVVTLKVLPRPRTEISLRIAGLDDQQAMTVMTRALRSQAAIAAAGYVPATPTEASSTLLRLEGFGPSVEARILGLSSTLDGTSVTRLSSDQANRFWSGIAMGAVLETNDRDVLWRVCLPATATAKLCTQLRALNGTFCADWGGSLLFARLSAAVPATKLRGMVEEGGGHATILRAPPEYRRTASVLHPQRPEVDRLAQRVKAAFDPANILDPWRFRQRTA